MSIIPLAIAAGLLLSPSTGAQPPTPATGTIVAQAPCAFTSYEEASAFTRRYYSRDEYTATVANPAVECLRIQYSSDGLKVVGFLVRPRANGAAKYPVIVYNRGGFRDIGKIDSWNLIDFYGFASQGFVVLASQYRGNDGGEGRDEVGGADVADVMALMQLARQLPYADAANVFLYGLSRGGMMSFLALKQGFPAKAAAVVGALFDLEAMNRRAPEMVKRAMLGNDDFARDAAAGFDPADMFDGNGGLLHVTRMPRHVRCALKSIKVVRKNLTTGDGVTDTTLEVQFWDKNTAIGREYQFHGLLVEKLEISAELANVSARLIAARKRLAEPRGKA